MSLLTAGPYTDIKDPNEDRTCNVWSSDLDTSSIDDDGDGREMVTCSFYRDSVQLLSDINFLHNNIIHYYAGFNVFEDNLSQYILSQGVSSKLEIKILEEAGAEFGLAAGWAFALLLASSLTF